MSEFEITLPTILLRPEGFNDFHQSKNLDASFGVGFSSSKIPVRSDLLKIDLGDKFIPYFDIDLEVLGLAG